jgi:Na+-transporting NADH:ubiquinone oxidoreductase subunit B
MRILEKALDSQRHLFEKGGKLEKFYALYEAADTFIFSPPSVTKTTAHVRDGIDLKRTMIMVAVALIPCVFMACYNTGYQANLILSGQTPEGWRAAVMGVIGLPFIHTNFLSNFVYGLLFFLPAYVVTMTVGGLWEALFAAVRGHEINEGFVVTGLLLPLTLPPTIPLWQIAVGVSFGVVIGKEIFGGTGKNIFNPALMSRAFLFFAYPAQISGDAVWTAVDGYTGATSLAVAAAEGSSAFSFSWMDAFLGFIPGSMGETSALACLLGAFVLILSGIGSWRIMLAMLIGMAGTAYLFNVIGSETNPMFALTPAWHFVIGSFAFACVFYGH